MDRCMRCGKEVNHDDLQLTYDYHGIPFRYVCEECMEQVYEIGYDGVPYSELDENLDYDY